MAAPDDLDALVRKLQKRGFTQSDAFVHECPECKQRGVLIFAITGRSGGRDIRICMECGDAKSWRNVAGMEGREADPTFDLREFVK
jgi:hypothetical protein